MTDPEPRTITVLLVEDDPGDVLMTREAFDEYLRNRLDVVTDGAAALAYLRALSNAEAKVQGAAQAEPGPAEAAAAAASDLSRTP